MRDELQDTFSKSFHLDSSSWNWFMCAGIVALVIYHNCERISACQKNLSLDAAVRRPRIQDRPPSHTKVHEETWNHRYFFEFLRVAPWIGLARWLLYRWLRLNDLVG